MVLSESKLLEIYGVGRDLGFLPNTPKLDTFVIESILNNLKKYPSDVECWIMIYNNYSRIGALEYCYQKHMNELNRGMIEAFNRYKNSKKKKDIEKYLKYLKNARSKY